MESLPGKEAEEVQDVLKGRSRGLLRIRSLGKS